MFKKKIEPYSAAEIQMQIDGIAHLNKLRDAALQKSVVYKGKAQATYEREAEGYSNDIAAAQAVLQFYYESVSDWQKQQKKGSK